MSGEAIAGVRRIRVHMPQESTFVIHIHKGRIDAVTADNWRHLLGKPEDEAAAELRAKGAGFVDLDGTVEVRYRAQPRQKVRPVK